MIEDPRAWRPLTAEDVVRRIAAECTFVAANGEVGIRLRPDAAIVRRYGSNSGECRHGGDHRHRSPFPCFDSV
jgi:hypothetical protein